MTVEKIKALLDACYQAKRARELLPALPKGVTSSYIQYLDAIERLECEGVRVKVSDISDALHLPRPGVTRTIGEMEDKGYLQKSASAEDGRVTYLTITEQGRKLSQTFNEQFFAQLAPLLDDISDEDAECTIRTIRALYDVMAERRITLVHRSQRFYAGQHFEKAVALHAACARRAHFAGGLRRGRPVSRRPVRLDGGPLCRFDR